MTTVGDDWPAHAIPITSAERELAVDTLLRHDHWARMFTRAALAEAVEGYFQQEWNTESLRHAVIFRPDKSRYGTPPEDSPELLARWAAWRDRPISGFELGTAMAAEFGRENERTTRDSWAAKAVPSNPIQAYRATHWMRFVYGWSKFGSVATLARTVTPWFARGWCPAAILWALEHRPTDNPYGGMAKSLEEVEQRLDSWTKAGRHEPPISGGTWQRIAEVRRERINISRENYDAAARVQQRRRLRYERWRHKRSLGGMKEEDAAIDLTLHKLYPNTQRLVGDDRTTKADGTESELCSCRRYWRVPGQRFCVPCLNQRGRSSSM